MISCPSIGLKEGLLKPVVKRVFIASLFLQSHKESRTKAQNSEAADSQYHRIDSERLLVRNRCSLRRETLLSHCLGFGSFSICCVCLSLGLQSSLLPFLVLLCPICRTLCLIGRDDGRSSLKQSGRNDDDLSPLAQRCSLSSARASAAHKDVSAGNSLSLRDHAASSSF